MIIGMYHGKTEFARRRIEEWKKLHPDARIQVFDPKEGKHEQISSSRTVDHRCNCCGDGGTIPGFYRFSEDWMDWPCEGNPPNC